MLGEKTKQAVTLLSLTSVLLQDKAKTTNTIHIKEEYYPFVALGPLSSTGPYFYLYTFKGQKALSQICWMVYMTLVMLPYTFFTILQWIEYPGSGSMDSFPSSRCKDSNLSLPKSIP